MSLGQGRLGILLALHEIERLQLNTTSSFCTKKGFIFLNFNSYSEYQREEFTPITIGIYQPESSTLFPAKPSHL